MISSLYDTIYKTIFVVQQRHYKFSARHFSFRDEYWVSLSSCCGPGLREFNQVWRIFQFDISLVLTRPHILLDTACIHQVPICRHFVQHTTTLLALCAFANLPPTLHSSSPSCLSPLSLSLCPFFSISSILSHPLPPSLSLPLINTENLQTSQRINKLMPSLYVFHVWLQNVQINILKHLFNQSNYFTYYHQLLFLPRS